MRAVYIAFCREFVSIEHHNGLNITGLQKLYNFNNIVHISSIKSTQKTLQHTNEYFEYAMEQQQSDSGKH